MEIKSKPIGPFPILHIITTLDVGGAEKYLHSLLTRLDRTLWKPYVIFLKGKGAFADSFRKTGIPAHGLRMSGAFDLATLVRLYQKIRQIRPCLVHTHLFKADFYGAIASWLAGVPVVISSKHNEDPELFHPFYGLLGRAAILLDTTVVTISDAVTAHLKKTINIPEHKVQRIYYGLDIDEFESSCNVTNLGIPRPCVGMVGRLYPQKGYNVFLKAASLVLKSVPNASFIIVGDGPEYKNLKDMARDLGIEKSVHFLGFRKDVRGIMSNLDIFVLSSFWEGFGLVLLEAMASGLPVVASRIGSIPEVVSEGQTGILVQPGDESGFASAIVGLLNSRNRITEMGKAGRIRAECVFSIKAMIEKTEKLYRGLMI